MPGRRSSTSSLPSRQVYPQELVHELEQLHFAKEANPRRRSTVEQKRDLIDVYRKYKKEEEPNESKATKANLQMHITSLTSIYSKHHGNNLGSHTKDYTTLAKEYKRMEKYRIHPRGAVKESDNEHLSCVICSRQGGLDKVFFPCQHRCVCASCILNTAKPLKQCPLCHAGISIVLSNTSNVYDEYWTWVEEVQTSTSTAFVKSFFIQSKDAIRLAMAKVNNNNFDDVPLVETSPTTNHCVEEDDNELLEHSIAWSAILSCLKHIFFFCNRRSVVRVHVMEKSIINHDQDLLVADERA